MNVKNIQRVVVVGAGASGQQIGVQFARFGYPTVIYDVEERRLSVCRERQRQMLTDLAAQSNLRLAQVDETLARLSYTTDASAASADVDVLSECVPEDLELKRGVFRQFHGLCKPETIFTTNTSYLMPSSLATASGRPERFAAFHFHVPVWYANAVDVAPTRRTLPEVTETLCDLARRIGQVPILARRENPGYVFNALLQPLLLSAIDLAARDVVRFQDVDRAWMAVTKMPAGPFGILDQIGLDTVHQIVKQSGRWLSDAQKQRAVSLLGPYVEQGCQGEKVGRGFYSYPQPEYRKLDFLSAQSSQATADLRPSKRRLVPVAVAMPLHAKARHEISAPQRVILWGVGDTALAVQRRLEQAGSSVCRVPEDLPTYRIADWHARLWSDGVAPHLILVSHPSVASPEGSTASGVRFEQHLEHPFLLAQAWFARLLADDLLDEAALLAIGRSGGHWGLGNEVARPADAGLAGLVKAVSLESMARGGLGMCAKAVDFPEQFAAHRCAELALHELSLAQDTFVTGDRAESRRRHASIEVGFANGQRHEVRYQIEPARDGMSPERNPRGVWLVSGGGGGITLRIATALARRYSLRLHLLGRTPLPADDYLQWSPQAIEALKTEVMKTAYRQKKKPNVAWEPYEKGIRLQRSLDSLRRQRIPVVYHVCDVSDGDAIARLAALIRKESGAIRGVLHGAGVEQTGRFELKTTASYYQTMAPKVRGACALFEATRQDPLEWFIAFSSLAGRFGGIGQVDYVMANEVLTSCLGQFARQRPDCRFLTIDWPAWDDVGMAARPASRYQLERAAHRLMPAAEGTEHFLAEIQAGAPDREVVFADPAELGPEFMWNET